MFTEVIQQQDVPFRTGQVLDTPGSSQITHAAISAFMQRTGLSIRGQRPDPDGLVEQRVREVVKTWDVDEAQWHRFNGNLIAAVNIAAATYAHTRIDTQVHIAVYTLLALCVDDLMMDKPAVEEFTQRLNAGSLQRHPLLQYLADNLSSMTDYFLPFASKAIVTATIDFVNHTFFDKETEHMPIHHAALRYAEYKRIKNGVAEAYAFFLWEKHMFPDVVTYIQVIPECILYFNYVNDIFSFYKEALDGELNNYLHDRAKVTDKTVAAALFDVVGDVVDSVNAVRTMLQGTPEGMVIERFWVGYLVFHFFSPRYRLLELTGTEYI